MFKLFFISIYFFFKKKLSTFESKKNFFNRNEYPSSLNPVHGNCVECPVETAKRENMEILEIFPFPSHAEAECRVRKPRGFFPRFFFFISFYSTPFSPFLFPFLLLSLFFNFHSDSIENGFVCVDLHINLEILIDLISIRITVTLPFTFESNLFSAH
jgi:hypothetical protein